MLSYDVSSPFQKNQIYILEDLHKGFNISRQFDDLNCIVDPQKNLGGIWLGNIEAASNLSLLQQLKIGAILTVCPQEIPHKVRTYLLKYQSYYADDVESFDISVYFDQSYDFIEQCRQRTNILIHCYAGVSRSATLLIAYLMRKNRMYLKNALDLVKSRRWQIYPNHGFLQQLGEFERFLFSQSNEAVKQRELRDQLIVQELKALKQQRESLGRYHHPSSQTLLQPSKKLQPYEYHSVKQTKKQSSYDSEPHSIQSKNQQILYDSVPIQTQRRSLDSTLFTYRG